MEILIALTVGTLNIVCFLIGVKTGQKVIKGETVELPSLNPMKAIREAQDRRESEREQDRLDAIMRNIEAYDGTSAGQKDVSR